MSLCEKQSETESEFYLFFQKNNFDHAILR